MTTQNDNSFEELPVDLDLNEAPDGPPCAPSGEYHLKIVECSAKRMNDKDEQGRDQYFINYRVVIQSGPHQGKSFFSMWSLKPDQQWRLKGDAKRLGYEPVGGKPVPRDMVGLEGIAKVTEQDKKDREGEITGKENRVAKWLSAAN